MFENLSRMPENAEETKLEKHPEYYSYSLKRHPRKDSWIICFYTQTYTNLHTVLTYPIT
jgi:hypothetical protein